ncbi:MAG: hypothetical protein AB7N76_28980 [Planctomycetota bacterium]
MLERFGGEPGVGLLFVGGSNLRHLAVREAQTYLRLDRTPSAWSHVAVVLHWPSRKEIDSDKRRSGLKVAKGVFGVEVALDPADPNGQLPERNGVTFFCAEDYNDARSYPNLAYARLGLTEDQEKALHAVALEPNRDRLRFPLWEWIAQWAGFVRDPATVPNPLRQGNAHPGSAFCEYLFEAAGVLIAPGLTAPNTAPEHLWSAVLYWHDRLQERPESEAPVELVTLVRDKAAQRSETRDPRDLAAEWARLTGSGEG